MWCDISAEFFNVTFFREYLCGIFEKARIRKFLVVDCSNKLTLPALGDVLSDLYKSVWLNQAFLEKLYEASGSDINSSANSVSSSSVSCRGLRSYAALRCGWKLLTNERLFNNSIMEVLPTFSRRLKNSMSRSAKHEASGSSIISSASSNSSLADCKLRRTKMFSNPKCLHSIPGGGFQLLALRFSLNKPVSLAIESVTLTSSQEPTTAYSLSTFCLALCKAPALLKGLKRYITGSAGLLRLAVNLLITLSRRISSINCSLPTLGTRLKTSSSSSSSSSSYSSSCSGIIRYSSLSTFSPSLMAAYLIDSLSILKETRHRQLHPNIQHIHLHNHRHHPHHHHHHHFQYHCNNLDPNKSSDLIIYSFIKT
ncbi:hypothetical protein FF38_09286 [Lucilia cuprina]|uniref:Uncharacterized protein n=1 Tax=Lucilia cuprina TaxID=7375 RepID=A0A0L0CFA1_LUCCU|nr:hypothetical protein FF38_09286 [Lucilia cuprina]